MPIFKKKNKPVTNKTVADNQEKVTVTLNGKKVEYVRTPTTTSSGSGSADDAEKYKKLVKWTVDAIGHGGIHEAREVSKKERKPKLVLVPAMYGNEGPHAVAVYPSGRLYKVKNDPSRIPKKEYLTLKGQMNVTKGERAERAERPLVYQREIARWERY